MMSLGTAEKVTAPRPRGVLAPVHFSDLCEMDLSPAHFKARCEKVFESTKDMRVGTIVHELVLGPHKTKRMIRYEAEERRGNAWRDFEAQAKAEHGPMVEIVTEKEWREAEPIADALKRDPILRSFLEGAYREKPLKWRSSGIECETDGIDIVQISGGMGLIADLKRTSCTEPRGFQRHAFKHHWHVQLPWYEEACQENGIDTSRGLFIIGAEPEPPYAVTALQLTTQLIDLGRRTYIKWLERLKRAREEDHWPGYTQTVVDFDVPEWMADDAEAA